MSMKTDDGRSDDASPIYEIRVEGQLDANWSDWFDGMRVTPVRGDGASIVTTLTGAVVDQAALHGILTRIRDLNLVLISVSRLTTSGSLTVMRNRSNVTTRTTSKSKHE